MGNNELFNIASHLSDALSDLGNIDKLLLIYLSNNPLSEHKEKLITLKKDIQRIQSELDKSYPKFLSDIHYDMMDNLYGGL